MGEELLRRGAALPASGLEWRRELEDAADHYRRAGDLGTSDLKLRALEALSRIFSGELLNDAGQRESVLRELIAHVPNDPQYAFDLARLYEQQGVIDSAEETLLSTRQRLPQDIEVFRQLAQFYARKVTALNTAARERAPAEPINPGQPDANGVYQVGGDFTPPRREGMPQYPDEAKAARIQGVVQAEIVVDENGTVVDARVIRSVPMLDDAALTAVREWRFAPKVVDGRAVPVKMTVMVSFTP